MFWFGLVWFWFCFVLILFRTDVPWCPSFMFSSEVLNSQFLVSMNVVNPQRGHGWQVLHFDLQSIRLLSEVPNASLCCTSVSIQCCTRSFATFSATEVDCFLHTQKACFSSVKWTTLLEYRWRNVSIWEIGVYLSSVPYKNNSLLSCGSINWMN